MQISGVFGTVYQVICQNVSKCSKFDLDFKNDDKGWEIIARL